MIKQQLRGWGYYPKPPRQRLLICTHIFASVPTANPPPAAEQQKKGKEQKTLWDRRIAVQITQAVNKMSATAGKRTKMYIAKTLFTAN